MQAGDRTTVAAVLNAPGFLSGMSDAEIADMRAAAARQFVPVEYEQLAATEAVISHIQRASGLLLGRYARIMELRTPARAEADDALKALRA